VQRKSSRPLAVPLSSDRPGSAFGLNLRCSFPLPGAGLAAAGDESLPACALNLVSEPELLAAWSGPASPDAWRGSLKDGSELAIQWGVRGDLLFRYGSRALFRLDREAAHLACAPAEPAAVSWRRILCGRVLPLVALAHGSEALHAAAVETPAGVVAIAGPSGAGKSTLAAQLLARGYPLFTDDVLVLSDRGGAIVAHPGGPYLSLAEGVVEPPPGETLDRVGGKRWIALREAARAPRSVAALVLLERGETEGSAVSRVPASPLPLAPFMLGLPDQPGREAARFSIYSDLVEGATLLRLRAGASVSPRALADELERALAIGTGAAVGSAA
jgi:hypothetical protein